MSKPTPYDICIALDPAEPGSLLAHRPDCPLVRAQAGMGDQVITMLQCQHPFPQDLKKHSCLEESLDKGLLGRELG